MDSFRGETRSPAQGVSTTAWTSVSAGESFTCALRGDDVLFGWGDLRGEPMGFVTDL